MVRVAAGRHSSVDRGERRRHDDRRDRALRRRHALGNPVARTGQWDRTLTFRAGRQTTGRAVRLSARRPARGAAGRGDRRAGRTRRAVARPGPHGRPRRRLVSPRAGHDGIERGLDVQDSRRWRDSGEPPGSGTRRLHDPAPQSVRRCSRRADRRPHRSVAQARGGAGPEPERQSSDVRHRGVTASGRCRDAAPGCRRLRRPFRAPRLRSRGSGGANRGCEQFLGNPPGHAEHGRLPVATGRRTGG